MTTAIAGMIERRTKLLGPTYKLFYEDPVHVVRGDGVWLFDSDDRKFLDMYNMPEGADDWSDCQMASREPRLNYSTMCYSIR